MKLYSMYATIPHEKDGWSGSRETPTFFVTAMNEEHARNVGEEVIRAAIGPSDKTFTLTLSEDTVTVDQLVQSRDEAFRLASIPPYARGPKHPNYVAPATSAKEDE